jgi:hypothetical protein
MAAKKASKTKKSSMRVRFVKEKDTKNKVKFQEVNSSGNPADSNSDVVGPFYVRRTWLEKHGLGSVESLSVIIHGPEESE